MLGLVVALVVFLTCEAMWLMLRVQVLGCSLKHKIEGGHFEANMTQWCPGSVEKHAHTWWYTRVITSTPRFVQKNYTEQMSIKSHV